MEISARKSTTLGKLATGCAIIPVFARKKLSDAGSQLDAATGGLLSSALRNGDISGNLGESLLLQTGADCEAKRVLMIGVGKAGALDPGSARKVIDTIVKALQNCKTRDASAHLAELDSPSSSLASLCEGLAAQLTVAAYQYRTTVSKPKTGLALKKLQINGGNTLGTRQTKAAIERGVQLGAGINVARQLGNLPGNLCTPSDLAAEGRKLARDHAKLSTRILDEKQMRELGMGALLSVSAGSDQPAKLIVMQYKGGKSKQSPYVLVGKGITFDSGGISLKPGGKMDEMKFDMCGAASVFGTMNAIVGMDLPLNVVAIVAAAENMPSGGATKPGDVVTSMSGQTIEVLNTDAEGRLVLCDALTYAERFKPAAVIDIATLTGACVVALGAHASGLYSNNDKLAEQLTQAGEDSFDRAWRMPLWKEYQRQIDTPFADMANIGGPGGGSITAACFLARYADKYHWAHLDIAGTAWKGAPKGATGRPVALLTRYLMDRAGV
jgi:leucyl aminopeptidase